MTLSRSLASLIGGVKSAGGRDFGRATFGVVFDTNELGSRFNKKERAILRRTGAFGRGVMRRLIRKAGKRYDPAKNDGPPRWHRRGAAHSLKDGIFFQVDLDRSAVAIGAVKVLGNVKPYAKASSAQLVNEGGAGIIRSYRHNVDRDDGTPRKPRWTRRLGSWKQRSFTEPAWAPTQDKMLELTRTIDL